MHPSAPVPHHDTPSSKQDALACLPERLAANLPQAVIDAAELGPKALAQPAAQPTVEHEPPVTHRPAESTNPAEVIEPPSGGDQMPKASTTRTSTTKAATAWATAVNLCVTRSQGQTGTAGASSNQSAAQLPSTDLANTLQRRRRRRATGEEPRCGSRDVINYNIANRHNDYPHYQDSGLTDKGEDEYHDEDADSAKRKRLRRTAPSETSGTQRSSSSSSGSYEKALIYVPSTSECELAAKALAIHKDAAHMSKFCSQLLSEISNITYATRLKGLHDMLHVLINGQHVWAGCLNSPSNSDISYLTKSLGKDDAAIRAGKIISAFRSIILALQFTK